MGQRANFVIKEGEDWELFYSHWAANSLDHSLFFGAQPALEFIRRQRPESPETGWLDEVWGEGGALMDLSARVLLFFGGQDILYEVPRRRCFLGMMAQAWPGWDLRWAHEGLGDLVDYLGLSRQLVRSGRVRDRDPVEVWPKPGDTLLSVERKLYSPRQSLDELIDWGPALLDQLSGKPAAKSYDFEDFPVRGLHLDTARRELLIWSADTCQDVPQAAARLWPDWRVIFLKDEFERHFERLEGQLNYRIPSRTELVESLSESLVRTARRSSADTVLELVTRERAAGKEVEVNPYALRDDPFDFSEERQRAIVSQAAAAYLISK